MLRPLSALVGGLGHLLLVLIWLLLLAPIGLLSRAAGADPLGLRRRPPGESYWRPAPARRARPERPL